jgi:hypothetical protein
MPPLLTVVASAVPPERTFSVFPLVTTTPELTTPEDTNLVVRTGGSVTKVPP